MHSQTSTANLRLVSIVELEPQNVLGVAVTPLLLNGETQDHFGLFHARVPPGVGIPLHSHPDIELFFILEGELEVSRLCGTKIEHFNVKTS